MRTETRACETRITTTCERCGCRVVISANCQNRVTYCADCIALSRAEKRRAKWIPEGTFHLVYDPLDCWTSNGWLSKQAIIDGINGGCFVSGTRFLCKEEVYIVQDQKLVKATLQAVV